jgi:hypothetical protein
MVAEPLRVLVVTESIPFPPRSGRELPTAHLVSGFARRFQVDLLVVSKSRELFERRRPNVPSAVRDVRWLRAPATSPLRRAAEEVIGVRPSYLARGFDAESVRAAVAGDYDLVWVSPIGLLGLVHFCRDIGLLRGVRVAVGLNDVKATLYADSARASLAGRGGLKDLLRGPRLLGLRAAERRLLRACELVHVQTERELANARALLGPSEPPRLVQAQNGRKDELLAIEPAGPESRSVLYMTHLSGGRARESAWFLERVWPLVRRRHARATLHLVGSPPPPGAPTELGEGVVAHGYVENLGAFLSTMRIAVVPILHGTGIINRIVDALAAGLPVVSGPGPLATVPGLVPGRHALAARTPAEFADAVSRLLADAELWAELSAAGRSLSRAQPTWEETEARVADAVASCCGRGPVAPRGRPDSAARPG